VTIDVLAFLGRAFFKTRLKLELNRLPSHHAFQDGDLGFVFLQKVVSSDLVVESTGFALGHPDADQLVTLPQSRPPLQGTGGRSVLNLGCGCDAMALIPGSLGYFLTSDLFTVRAHSIPASIRTIGDMLVVLNGSASRNNWPISCELTL
jgi:hypothetical protein